MATRRAVLVPFIPKGSRRSPAPRCSGAAVGRTRGHVTVEPTRTTGRGDLGGRALRDLERQAIVETMKLTGGNKAETAKRLGISRRALYDKIEKYGLK